MTVGDLVSALDRRFPLAWADPWDRVGLVAGEEEMAVSGVLVTLDATGAAVARAAHAGANVLVTHHPPFLEPPSHTAPSAGPRGTLHASIRHGVAVVSLHTCLDRAPQGAEALARALDLDPGEPLESGVEEIAVVTAFVPSASAEGVRQAMSAAGAGRIGQYERCAYVGEGTGRFVPLDGAAPAVPRPEGGVAEARIEMVCPRAIASRVVAAAQASHPYEEPLIVATDAVRARGIARYGRICTWDRPGTVADLAVHVGTTLGTRPRIWGDVTRGVSRIGVANGSGSSLLPAAAASVDVLVTGEVRYHDALDAVADGLAIIEVGHDATEWPLVRVLASAVTEAVGPGTPVIEEPPALMWRTTEDLYDRS
jgi:dinuclear metal center YbgI/SA1388 family protein